MIILQAATAESLGLAFLEWGIGLTAFGDPAIVSDRFYIFPAGAFCKTADVWSRCFLSGF